MTDGVSGLRYPRRPLVRLLGAAGSVTGSRFLVETPRSRILVDCGLFQGPRRLRDRNWAEFPVEPSSIDAVVLTHAHLDHSGYLPRLVRGGFAGPILATPRTVGLCGVLFPDSGRIQEEDAEYANRKGYSKHRPALPLYTEADAVEALTRFSPLPFHRTTEVGSGVEVRLTRAGHILGSATVTVSIDGEPNLLTVSGDLGHDHHPLLEPPEPPPSCGTLLIESTYGDRSQQRDETGDVLADALVRVAERGGAAVIPAFSVDRTEVVLMAVKTLMATGRVPEMPVYLDSPLAQRALAIYRAAVSQCDDEIRDEIAGTADPFSPPNLTETGSVEESKEINHAHLPAIIISASGMATGGRVVHHLQRRLPDPNSMVILVGYQAPGTRGARLLAGERSLKMYGSYVPVRADVVSVAGFSVHADADELVGWARSAPAPPRQAIAVHGELEASAALARRLEAELGWVAAVGRSDERLLLH